jgi:hypothetical protein
MVLLVHRDAVTATVKLAYALIAVTDLGTLSRLHEE